MGTQAHNLFCMINEYQVLARKYRPQKFAEVVGQGPIVTTLKNAIQMGRTAHAYLFCGCRGTGKTTLARLFAKTLNCIALTDEIEPCNSCASCREIAAGHAIDVLEIDGASHRGIEDIRQINETIAFTPTGGRYKIYLIDEVHMLTKEAFNALLKTLEEPPPHVKFFFCTTEPHRIPSTILSRCQRFNLRRIPIEKMEQQLAKILQESGIAADPAALSLIAQRAEGSLRDALSVLDQMIACEAGTLSVQAVTATLGIPPKEICFALDEAGYKQDGASLFKIAAEVYESGYNLSHFIEELVNHFRSHLLSKCGAPLSDKRYQLSSPYRIEQLIQILELLTEGQQALKTAPSERTALEMLFLRILRTHQQLPVDLLIKRLIELEQKLATSEDPMPRLEDLPAAPPKKELPKPIPAAVPPPPTTTAAVPPAKATSAPPSIQEQSRFDTVMRFAAKELNGSIKKS